MKPTLPITPGVQNVTCGPCTGRGRVPDHDLLGRLRGRRDCQHCGGRGFVTTTVTVWR